MTSNVKSLISMAMNSVIAKQLAFHFYMVTLQGDRAEECKIDISVERFKKNAERLAKLAEKGKDIGSITSTPIAVGGCRVAPYFGTYKKVPESIVKRIERAVDGVSSIFQRAGYEVQWLQLQQSSRMAHSIDVPAAICVQFYPSRRAG
jgi:hypothetical protein